MAARPPPPQHTAPPTDPRLRNTSTAGGEPSKTLICRDFVWGICNKATQCKFRHELEFESMRSILKFCHDYQNKTGCTRPDCTYLHVTREEENLFLTTGQVPRVLATRHAAAMSCNPNIYGLTSDNLSAPPPPPPPLASATGTGAAPPPLPPVPVLMPPPPPPPPTTVVTPVVVTPTLFTAPPPINPSAMFQPSQPLPALPNFDATRPPPPLSVTPISNGPTKRPAEPAQAGPSKVRKPEVFNNDSSCENCAQLEFRIKVHRQTQEKLEGERECKTFIFEKKTEEYDNGKLLLKCAVSPELFRLLDEYIEGTSTSPLVQVHDLLSHFGSASSFLPGTSTVPKQLLLQLMDCVFRDPRSSIEPSPVNSTAEEDSSFLQTLAKLANRPSPSVSSNVAQALFDVIRNPTTPSSERSPGNDSRVNVSATTSTPMKNGGRYLSSGKPENVTTQPHNNVPASVAPRPYLATAPVVPQAPLFNFAESAVAPITAPPPNIPNTGRTPYMYQPSIQPPNARPPYYSMPYDVPQHPGPAPTRPPPPAPYHAPYQRYPPYYQPPYQ